MYNIININKSITIIATKKLLIVGLSALHSLNICTNSTIPIISINNILIMIINAKIFKDIFILSNVAPNIETLIHTAITIKKIPLIKIYKSRNL